MTLPENQIRHVDRPDLFETFVDSLGVVTFDGNTRLELCVTRVDPPVPPDPPTAKRYPVCRVVMTPETTVALFNQLQNIMNLLQQAGLVTKQEGKPPEVIKQH
ncbi:MAG: hypothetical protein R6W75_13705 [Smithellaceae bacterium]